MSGFKGDAHSDSLLLTVQITCLFWSVVIAISLALHPPPLLIIIIFILFLAETFLLPVHPFHPPSSSSPWGVFEYAELQVRMFHRVTQTVWSPARKQSGSAAPSQSSE